MTMDKVGPGKGGWLGTEELALDTRRGRGILW